MRGDDGPPAECPRSSGRIPIRHRLLLATLLLVLTIANLTLRFWRLDSVPGINGDEAWYGVQVQRWLAAQEWSSLTPSGLPINPLLFGTEAALLRSFEASFWTLRLPVALWCGVSILLTGCLHRWVYGDTGEAIWAALLTACLPAHLVYSRFAWDPSFGFVPFAFLLYGTLKLSGTWSSWWAGALVLIGAGLAVAVHAANGLFVLACIAALAWQHARGIARWARRRPLSAAFGSCLVLAAGWLCVSFLAGTRAVEGVRSRWGTTFITADLLLAQLAALGDLILGPRVYGFIAAVPRSWYWPWLYGIVGVAAAGLSWRVMSTAAAADRLLMRLTPVTLLFVTLVGPFLWFERISFERYFLYLVPLAGLLCVRIARSSASFHVASGIMILIAAAFLGQFWFNYHVAIRDQTYFDQIDPTFRTGDSEPKAAAVRLLRSRPEFDGAAVFAERWWLEYPVQYLLGPDRAVSSTVPQKVTGSDRLFVMGFAGEEYIERVRRAAAEKDWTVQERTFSDRMGRPVVHLLEIQ